jgi:hypothetical protein
MKRRDFVAGVLLGTTIPHAQAQQHSKVYRLALAAPSTPITEMNRSTCSAIASASSTSIPGDSALDFSARKLPVRL